MYSRVTGGPESIEKEKQLSRGWESLQRFVMFRVSKKDEGQGPDKKSLWSLRTLAGTLEAAASAVL